MTSQHPGWEVLAGSSQLVGGSKQRAPSTKEEKKKVWAEVAACLSYDAWGEGYGSFFGVVPNTVPPGPSDPVFHVGFPRQVAQGRANIGVVISVEGWGGVPAPLHEGLQKEKFTFEVTNCEEIPQLTLHVEKGKIKISRDKSMTAMTVPGVGAPLRVQE